jgi:hypothetical protein
VSHPWRVAHLSPNYKLVNSSTNQLVNLLNHLDRAKTCQVHHCGLSFQNDALHPAERDRLWQVLLPFEDDLPGPLIPTEHASSDGGPDRSVSRYYLITLIVLPALSTNRIPCAFSSLNSSTVMALLALFTLPTSSHQ